MRAGCGERARRPPIPRRRTASAPGVAQSVVASLAAFFPPRRGRLLPPRTPRRCLSGSSEGPSRPRSVVTGRAQRRTAGGRRGKEQHPKEGWGAQRPSRADGRQTQRTRDLGMVRQARGAPTAQEGPVSDREGVVWRSRGANGAAASARPHFAPSLSLRAGLSLSGKRTSALVAAAAEGCGVCPPCAGAALACV